jgi:hypothetical protein
MFALPVALQLQFAHAFWWTGVVCNSVWLCQLPLMMELCGPFISTFLFHEHLPDDTSSFLMFDRDEAFDTVLVSKEDLIVDIPLYEKGQGEMFDGESLYCLLIGHTTRDMAREGHPPELSSLSIVLKPSISVPGAYERVGMLQSDRGDDWFQEAMESIIVIV